MTEIVLQRKLTWLSLIMSYFFFNYLSFQVLHKMMRFAAMFLNPSNFDNDRVGGCFTTLARYDASTSTIDIFLQTDGSYRGGVYWVSYTKKHILNIFLLYVNSC